MTDLHNHTYLCGHAEGDPEDYVETAYRRGIKYFGFSDHAPIPADMRRAITMAPDQTELYISLVDKIRRKYSGKIEIFTGFEVDYPLFSDFDKKYFDDDRIDYLIGSCHFIDSWPIDMSEQVDEYDRRGINNVCREYFSLLLKMAESGKFNIIGHFDLFKKFGHRPDADFSEIISKIVAAAASNNTSIEINTSGLRKPVKEMYPSETIIRIINDSGGFFTLGSDSHKPDDVAADFNSAFSMLKENGIKTVSYYRKRKRIEVSI